MLVAVLAALAICLAVWQLARTTDGLVIEAMTIGTTPATIFRPVDAGRTPVVVIAHGFAGSQQLMRPFAITFARNGLTAVTFDFLGHGRNPAPLTGSITEVSGATQALVNQTAQVVAFARQLGDGRVAIVGHSMATDIVVRVAEADPRIAATVAVSLFSPAVTATAPKNLLDIVGAWEPGLTREALRVTGLAAAPRAPEAGVTYGDFADGTARRMVIAPDVEHVSVLYSRTAMAEAQAWLDQAFGRPPGGARYADARGGWVLLLLAGVVAMMRPLASVLPVAAAAPVGGGMPWRQLWSPLLAATVATPLILRVVPTHFLPVLVGDYLSLHFLLFGVLFALAVRLRRTAAGPSLPVNWPRLLLSCAILACATTGGLAAALDTQVTSFWPGANRWPLILALLVGTLSFFLALEWATHGPKAARGSYVVAKTAFVLSLAIAVALDFENLFFLVIILPVVLLFFVITGLFSRWAYRRTHHPFAAAVANAVLFAWAIGVTFPFLAR